MNKIDMKEYEEKFRKMWITLYEHPDLTKHAYLIEYDPIESMLVNHCHACQFVADMLNIKSYDFFDGYCNKCPVEWKIIEENIYSSYSCNSSFYYMWVTLNCKHDKDNVDLTKMRELAKIISELPWINKFEEK
jgi:hypothetical protein